MQNKYELGIVFVLCSHTALNCLNSYSLYMYLSEVFDKSI